MQNNYCIPSELDQSESSHSSISSLNLSLVIFYRNTSLQLRIPCSFLKKKWINFSCKSIIISIILQSKFWDNCRILQHIHFRRQVTTFTKLLMKWCNFSCEGKKFNFELKIQDRINRRNPPRLHIRILRREFLRRDKITSVMNELKWSLRTLNCKQNGVTSVANFL